MANRRKDRPCKSCGIWVPSKRSYCKKCFLERRHIKKVTRLEDTNNPKIIKRIILSERGESCENCGLSEWLGIKIRLDMHHIDGNPDNNNRENLKLLCPNCHSLTENYGARNIGSENSRSRYRRKYYDRDAPLA